MKDFMKILGFALIILSVLSQQKYQERVIYYSQTDNVCRFGEKSDNINLIINIDDTSTIRRNIDGETICFQWSIRYANAISPLNRTELFQFDGDKLQHNISFYQEATRKYTFGVLSQLIQKVTVNNPAILYGKNHTCTVFGDGTLQHFGTWYSSPPAEIYLRCLSSNSQGIEQGQKNINSQKR